MNLDDPCMATCPLQARNYIIACYAVFALFALVTLPVEFDASRRALRLIDDLFVFVSYYIYIIYM